METPSQRLYVGAGSDQARTVVCGTCGKRLIQRPSHQRCRFENRIVTRYGKKREIRVKIIDSLVVCEDGHKSMVEITEEIPKRTSRSRRAF